MKNQIKNQTAHLLAENQIRISSRKFTQSEIKNELQKIVSQIRETFS